MTHHHHDLLDHDPLDHRLLDHRLLDHHQLDHDTHVRTPARTNDKGERT
jgi:hypothetical protein